jgi:hypothetical protein
LILKSKGGEYDSRFYLSSVVIPGLAYNERNGTFRDEEYPMGFDDVSWIQMKRENTTDFPFQFFPKAQGIIVHKVFNRSNLSTFHQYQKFNSYLKVLLLQESKNTHHIAGKRSASTVLLYNDVPLWKSYQELLGHSNMDLSHRRILVGSAEESQRRNEEIKIKNRDEKINTISAKEVGIVSRISAYCFPPHANT